MSVFHDLVKKKLAAMKASKPPIRSAHEGLGLILEEVRELETEVFKRKRKEDPLRFLNELVDIAAMCELFAENSRSFNERDFKSNNGSGSNGSEGDG